MREVATADTPGSALPTELLDLVQEAMQTRKVVQAWSAAGALGSKYRASEEEIVNLIVRLARPLQIAVELARPEKIQRNPSAAFGTVEPSA